MSKIAKLVQLFEQGKVITVPLPQGKELHVWVQKLSPFHYEECIHQGRIARSLKMMAIREVGSDEYNLFQGQVGATSKDALVAGLVMVKEDEFLVDVLREIRTEDEWREKIEILEHAPEQLEGKDKDDIDVKQAAKILDDYQEELLKRQGEAKLEYRNELMTKSEEVLREQFLEHWVEQQGKLAFTVARQRYEFYYCARQCLGTYDEAKGAWDHSECDHTLLLLDEANDVNQLPEELITLVTATLMELTVPPDLARFTDGPVSSSDSLGPSSPQEDSEASSEGTSETPVTT